MKSLLIKDTTRDERARIVEESLGEMGAACDGCAAGVIDMYDDYIEGRLELSEVNARFRAHYESGNGDDSELRSCDYSRM
ncbi:MAG: purine biosynthesis protein PurH [Eubacterium sp.]|nr:purine biosynthesis protein PurH [Eubacterium sp.]